MTRRLSFLSLLVVLCIAAVERDAHAEGAILLGSATAAPGESEVVIPITFDVDPDESLVQALEFTVQYDPAVFGEVRIEPIEDADFYRHMDQVLYTEPGNVGAAIVWDLFFGIRGIEETQVFAELRCCVLPDAEPGDYPIEILEVATRRRGRPEIWSVYTVSGQSRTPSLVGGQITIEGDPVDGECTVDDREIPPDPPDPPRPDEFAASYSLPDDSASAGSAFSLPLVVRGNAGIAGFSFSIDFDERVLSATDVDPLFERENGQDYDFMVVTMNNDDEHEGSDGVDEGYLIGAVILSFTDTRELLPVDTDVEMLSLTFEVAESAPPQVTELQFLDGGRPSPGGPGTTNVTTMFHESVNAEFESSMVFINGVVEIIGDVSVFVRGDSNGTHDVDMSDAIRTLGFLFLGGEAPFCYDGADATDDGVIDMTDAIRTLAMLFLGAEPLPAPFPDEGEDPTPDDITCSIYTG